MSLTRPPYPSGFREQLVELVRAGTRLDPVRVFEFVRANRAMHPVATMCRRLGRKSLDGR